MSARITITIPVRYGPPIEAEAIAINKRWCAYRAHALAGWSLTHRATGYSAGRGLRSVKACAQLCRALERAYPVKRWTFTDPNAVRGMKKCRAIIEKHGAYL